MKQIAAKFAVIGGAIFLSLIPFTTEIALFDAPTWVTVPYYVLLAGFSLVARHQFRDLQWAREAATILSIGFSILAVAGAAIMLGG